jgi:hypothetical protein
MQATHAAGVCSTQQCPASLQACCWRPPSYPSLLQYQKGLGLSGCSPYLSALFRRELVLYDAALPCRPAQERKQANKPLGQHFSRSGRVAASIACHQMDGVVDKFWKLPRKRRLAESLMLCEDLLCLANHRLPTAQGSVKEMCVSQPKWQMANHAAGLKQASSSMQPNL